MLLKMLVCIAIIVSILTYVNIHFIDNSIIITLVDKQHLENLQFNCWRIYTYSHNLYKIIKN